MPKSTLAATVGRLAVVDLKLSAEVCDVDKHYDTVRNERIGFDTVG